MSSNLAVYRSETALAERSTFDVMPMAIQLADQLAMTEFVPKGLRGNKPAIMAAILTGHEVGLPPMASLANIDVIEGRPRLAAAGQRALILSHGHEIGFEEMTTTRCVMWGRRKGAQQITTVTWTLDDAKRAGLAAKQNWTKHPGDMLVARATGKLARAIFADVIVGIPYNREELDDEFEDGGSIPPPGASVEGNASRKRKATRSAVEPPPAPPIEPGPGPGLARNAETLEIESAAPPADPSQAPANEQPADGSMPLNQQLAMVCRELGIERRDLIRALTGKERGSDLTREEAIGVLEEAQAIRRGEKRLVQDDDGLWMVVPVVEDPHGEGEQP